MENRVVGRTRHRARASASYRRRGAHSPMFFSEYQDGGTRGRVIRGCREPAQKVSFRPNWIWRGVLPGLVEVMVPALALYSVDALKILLFGFPKFSWLKMLKNSARN